MSIMDEKTIIAAVIAVITGILSAGAFKFYEFVLKQKREIAKDDQTNKAMYRDDLIDRVEKLEAERTANIDQIMKLMTSVTSLQIEMDYLKRDNEILKLKLEAMR
jgi:uncharacterized membrane protein YgaE (UPF0421/DUF939 family)|tara:strand:+ start:1942 stop:2256 length:315 start_codon:yes stop_codon:yes gene_type:complete